MIINLERLKSFIAQRGEMLDMSIEDNKSDNTRWDQND